MNSIAMDYDNIHWLLTLTFSASIGAFIFNRLYSTKIEVWVLAVVNVSFYLLLANNSHSLFLEAVFLGCVMLAYPVLMFANKFGVTILNLVLPISLIVIFNFLLPANIDSKITFDYFSSAPHILLILGTSYISFRMLMFFADYKKIADFNFLGYISYALFWPTCFVGPITCPKKFMASMNSSLKKLEFSEDSIGRILFGLVKIFLFSSLINRGSFESIIFDGNHHNFMAFLVASINYYIFLYLNFSGSCDVAIGVSKIFGLHVCENFNEPYRATNISDYWDRQHMTLTRLLRRFIFTPISMYGFRMVPRKYQGFVVAFALFATFLAVAVWHGIGINFVLFGFCHGGASAIWYGWSRLKKKFRGKMGSTIFDSKVYLVFCWTFTQIYVALTMVFFANDFGKLQTIGPILGI